jgi:hypothetical protein
MSLIKKKLFLPYGGSGDQRNLHKVTWFEKNGKSIAFKLQQVYSFEKDKTITTAKPWFKPACEKVARDTQKIFIGQMKKLGM